MITLRAITVVAKIGERNMPITRGNGMTGDPRPVGEIFPPARATESEEEDESPPIEEHGPEDQTDELTTD